MKRCWICDDAIYANQSTVKKRDYGFLTTIWNLPVQDYPLCHLGCTKEFNKRIKKYTIFEIVMFTIAVIFFIASIVLSTLTININNEYIFIILWITSAVLFVNFILIFIFITCFMKAVAKKYRIGIKESKIGDDNFKETKNN